MDKKTMESIRIYNKIATQYDKTFDGRFTRRFKEEIAGAIMLKEGGNILDVACGNGMLLKMLSDKADFQAYGVDISEKMIIEARNRYPKMQFSVTNSSRLPFQADFFDAVTVCAAFHHFSEPEEFVSEAKRVLKPGGQIYIADPYFPPLFRQIANLIIPLMKMGDVKVYKKSELIKFFKDEGFNNITVRRFGTTGYLLEGIK
jgi:demethylmenaquinone methyltransferase/2-methoxy-6-polyprenyl-1,4-benzoquinol methylase